MKSITLFSRNFNSQVKYQSLEQKIKVKSSKYLRKIKMKSKVKKNIITLSQKETFITAVKIQTIFIVKVKFIKMQDNKSRISLFILT